MLHEYVERMYLPGPEEIDQTVGAAGAAGIAADVAEVGAAAADAAAGGAPTKT